MAAGNLWVNLGLRSAGLDKGLKKSSRSMKTFGSQVKTMSKTLLAFGGVAGFGILAKQMVASASAAEETQAKFNTVFKELAQTSAKWAEEFGDNVGRATQDVQMWMATLQDTFVPLGIARDEAAALGESLVSLAVDVASFNNRADAEVIRDFTSALVGNHETVRKYGIIISAAGIAQEALNQGMNKTFTELTDLEKVQLRYVLIQKGSNDAQGDAVRTGDSYANQIKRLSANITELKTALGGPVTSLLADFAAGLNAVAHAAQRLDEAIVPTSGRTTFDRLQGLSPQNQIAAMAEYKSFLQEEAQSRMKPGVTATQNRWREDLKLLNEIITDYENLDKVIGKIESHAKMSFVPLEDVGMKAQAAFELERQGMFDAQAQQRSVDAHNDRLKNFKETEEAAKKAAKGVADAAEEAQAKWQAVSQTMEFSMTSAFDKIVFEGGKWKDAMMSILRDVARELARVMVFQNLSKSIVGHFTPADLEGAPRETNVKVSHSGGRVANDGLFALQRGEFVQDRVSAKGGGQAPTVIFNNTSGVPLAQDGPARFDGKAFVIGVTLENIQNRGELFHATRT